MVISLVKRDEPKGKLIDGVKRVNKKISVNTYEEHPKFKKCVGEGAGGRSGL